MFSLLNFNTHQVTVAVNVPLKKTFGTNDPNPEQSYAIFRSEDITLISNESAAVAWEFKLDAFTVDSRNSTQGLSSLFSVSCANRTHANHDGGDGGGGGGETADCSLINPLQQLALGLYAQEHTTLTPAFTSLGFLEKLAGVQHTVDFAYKLFDSNNDNVANANRNANANSDTDSDADAVGILPLARALSQKHMEQMNAELLSSVRLAQTQTSSQTSSYTPSLSARRLDHDEPAPTESSCITVR